MRLPGPFGDQSRYATIETAEHTMPDGRTVRYVRRRFIAPPSSHSQLGVHVVVEGDRLDRLAANYLADPEAYWLIADANGAVDPDALTDVPGERLRITLPSGIPGGFDD